MSVATGRIFHWKFHSCQLRPVAFLIENYTCVGCNRSQPKLKLHLFLLRLQSHVFHTPFPFHALFEALASGMENSGDKPCFTNDRDVEHNPIENDALSGSDAIWDWDGYLLTLACWTHWWEKSWRTVRERSQNRKICRGGNPNSKSHCWLKVLKIHSLCLGFACSIQH